MKRMCFALMAPMAFVLSTVSAQADKLSLNAISQYLNGIKTAEAEFTQVNADGTLSTGTLYIRRPGKMRFEYDGAQGGAVLATNGAVYIVDAKSNQSPETYPLSRTPLSIILARTVNLGQANMVVGHGYDGVSTVVRAQDPRNPEYGSIEMMFTDSPVELRKWVIHGSAGEETTVILGALETGVSLASSLFRIPSKSR